MVSRLFFLLLCMKKIILVVASFIIAFSTQGQEVTFKWQPNGSMLTEEGKSYQVVSFEGKTKESLYNELLVSVSSIYNNPQHVVSSVENELISINATQPVSWHLGELVGTQIVTFHYVLKLHVKDGKVKIDAPYFTHLTFSSGGSQPNIPGWVKTQKFFNADGTPNSKRGRGAFCISVSQNFNNLINSILKLESDDNDW